MNEIDVAMNVGFVLGSLVALAGIWVGSRLA